MQALDGGHACKQTAVIERRRPQKLKLSWNRRAVSKPSACRSSCTPAMKGTGPQTYAVIPGSSSSGTCHPEARQTCKDNQGLGHPR